METRTTYLIDDKPVEYDVWSKSLDKNIELEEEKWDSKTMPYSAIKSAIFCDLCNGRVVEVNGYTYGSVDDFTYSSAKELLEEIMNDGEYDLIFDVIWNMNEEELNTFAAKIEGIQTINGAFVRKG